MSMFHSVPGVPRAKMERFGGFAGVSWSQTLAGRWVFTVSPLVKFLPQRPQRKHRDTKNLICAAFNFFCLMAVPLKTRNFRS